MEIYKKALRNFIIANLGVVLPLFLILGWHSPVEFEMQIATGAPMTLSVGESCCHGKVSNERSVGVVADQSGGFKTCHFFCSLGDYEDGISYKFIGAQTEFVIGRATILRHACFQWVMMPDEMVRIFQCSDGAKLDLKSDGLHVHVKSGECTLTQKPGSKCWRQMRLTLSPHYMGYLRKHILFSAISIEFLLLLVSLIFAGRNGALIVNERNQVLVQSLTIAFLFALLIVYLVPIQTVLGNRTYFSFSTCAILYDGRWLFLCLFLLALSSMLVSSIGFGRFVHALFVSVIVYEYVQINFLSLGAPGLDGDTSYYKDIPRALVDFGVLIGVLSCIISVAIKKGHWLHWIALAVVVLFSCSLLDVKSVAPKDEGIGDNPFVLKGSDVLRSFRFSEKQNILIFVLDTTQSDVMTDIIKNESTFKDMFRGFVAYDNNIGMHDYTASAMLGNMTGEYCGEEIPRWYRLLEDNSCVSAFIKTGDPVHVVMGNYGCKKNVRAPEEMEINQSDATPRPFYTRISSSPYLSLCDVVLFRLSPFVMKRYVFGAAMKGVNTGNDVWWESVAYPMLANLSVESGLERAVLLLQTNGAHPTINYDRHGNRIYSGPQDYNAMYEQCVFVMKNLGWLFSRLRKRGIYDNSMIMIFGDHGGSYSEARTLSGEVITGRAIPMLWVKPFGPSEKDLAISTLSTSHAGISKVLRLSHDKRLILHEVNEALMSTNRLYRAMNIDTSGEFTDLWVDSTGHCTQGGGGTVKRVR